MYRSLICPVEDVVATGGSLFPVDEQGNKQGNEKEEIKELSIEDYNGISHRCFIQRVVVETSDILPNVDVDSAMNGIYGNALILSSPYQEKLYTDQSYFFMHFPILTVREYVETPIVTDRAFVDSMSAHISGLSLTGSSLTGSSLTGSSLTGSSTSLSQVGAVSQNIIIPESTENNDSLYIKSVGNLDVVWLGDLAKDDAIRYQDGYEKIGRLIREEETFYILVGEAVLHGYVLTWERKENVDKPTKIFFSNISSRLIP